MIAYFDTSAVIPLLITEPGSRTARRLWDEARRLVSVRLVYAEARAALAQARRMDRLTEEQLTSSVEQFESLYGQLDRIEIDEWLVRRAGLLAETHPLRGYDAIHLAGVERVDDNDTVLVAGDHDLCDAAAALGLTISRIDRPDLRSAARDG